MSVAAGAGSMTHKARGEYWVQRVSKLSKGAEVVVAAVAGDGAETAWFGTMSYVNGRIVAADSVRGSFARLETLAVKMAGENQAATWGTLLIEVESRATNAESYLVEVRRTKFA